VVLEWLTQLVLGLEHLHHHRVLHRDIKSENIFLSKPDARGKIQVLLGDFGVSRVLENSGQQAQTMCGTPYYMSPELVKVRETQRRAFVRSVMECASVVIVRTEAKQLIHSRVPRRQL
jgi:NIMA (never in mitosis gene a)-related kinase